MRAKSTNLLKNDVTGNPFVWAALGLCTALLILVVYQPFMAGILELVNPDLAGWLLVLVTSSMTCFIGQLWKIRDKQSN
jgi:Ca2+-transporting ATPase